MKIKFYILISFGLKNKLLLVNYSNHLSPGFPGFKWWDSTDGKAADCRVGGL